jgi:L-lactate dehydrogenase complex protein LldF
MPDPFHSHIRSALSDLNLQAALDANAMRRRSAREQAFVSLPEDLQVMRQRAHAVRLETITHLDQYLRQFTDRAQANGLTIHRAADAAGATGLVLEIARQHNAKLIAKSKTMVSEEIGLNHALEKNGIKVVETDLGEFIVQLRGEAPAHIITPAVHLRREDVGLTFNEKLDLPLTDDIATMTAAARRVLRQTFLDAEIGISGVNFGVAETGSLCLVTNEGNGRMVTTLPPVHIALMGIERLVPTLDDLALMLYLLPRHATGQKLTVYTSLIHGPRRSGDPDGPVERHLILLDNGRDALRKTPLAESLLCIRCGACLNVCPVFQEIGGHSYVSRQGKGSTYPGPIGSVISPALFGVDEFGQLARASSLCGACREACPVDIDLPRLLLRIRAGGTRIEMQRIPANVPAALALGLRAFAWIAASPRRFAAAQKLAWIASRAAAPFSNWLRLPAFTGWGYSKDFPRPAARSFRERWSERSNGKATPLVDGGRSSPQESPSRHPINIPPPPIVQTPQPASSTNHLYERFSVELSELGGSVVRCRSEELPERVLALLAEKGINAILAWESRSLPSDILEKIERAGVRVSSDADPTLRAGLTGALAGVAETGTLVLTGGAGRPLTASLLPEIHIAVLKTRDIYEKLPQVLHLRELREAASATLITGPSRTADIEMTLTIGVHGPGEVHVFCI